MDSNSAFDIRFPTYTSGGPPQCGPKSTLTGLVYMHLQKPVRASCLSLNLIGSERILLAPSSASHEQLKQPRKPASRGKTVKKIYFNQSAILWGDSKLHTLEWLNEGVHMFHFSCEFPRVNYPQSKSTPEYEIKYVLQAKLFGTNKIFSTVSKPPRGDPMSCLFTARQPIIYCPEIITPLAQSLQHQSDSLAKYKFCDNAVDVGDGQRAYHLQVMGLQQAFCPGDTVDFQLRLTGGQRSLKRAQFCIVEQTDCFYPQIPGPHEEQLDLGRRLWSSRRLMSATSDLPFERDTCVLVPDLCPEHMNGKRARGSATYYAHMHVRLPRDILVLPETGYLRYTYFAEVTLHSSNSSSAAGTSNAATGWGGGKKSVVKVPIPVASCVLKSSTDQRSTHRTSVNMRQSLRVSSHTGGQRNAYMAESGEDTVSSLDLLKRGRSLANLGARLRQHHFIPKRGSLQRKGNSSTTANSQDSLGLSTSSLLSKFHGGGQKPQALLVSSPLTRGASISLSDGNVSQQQQQRSSNVGHVVTTTGGQFSLTFLLRMREFNYTDANRFALANFIEGSGQDESTVIIPNALYSLSSQQQHQQQQQQQQKKNGNSSFSLYGSYNSSKHKSRASIMSVSGVVSESLRVRPRIDPVMTTYRNPATNKITTWSAMVNNGYQRQSVYSNGSSVVSAGAAMAVGSNKTRYSGMSVSSNDTACASTPANQKCLLKDAAPLLPLLQNFSL